MALELQPTPAPPANPAPTNGAEGAKGAPQSPAGTPDGHATVGIDSGSSRKPALESSHHSAADGAGGDPADDPLPPPLLRTAPFFRPYWSADFFVTALFAILVIWGFCWMYVGAFWNPLSRLSNLQVLVLDCDTLPAAAALNASFAQLLPLLVPSPVATSLLAPSVWDSSSALGRTLGWQAATCEGAPQPQQPGRGCGPREAECLAALSNEVLQGGPWALLYFPSNFTTSYLSWFPTSGVTPQQQRPVGQYVVARGRDYSTYSYLANVVLYSAVPSLSRSFVTALAANQQLMQLLSPAFLATGLTVREVDLAPVRHFGQHFATYIFCVLLWLGSTFVVATSYQFKLPAEVALHHGGHDWPEHPKAAMSPAAARMARLRCVAWALWIKAVVATLFMFLTMVLLCAVVWALGTGDSPDQWAHNPGEAIAFGWYMSWSFIAINGVLLHAMGIERFSSISALLLILQLTSASAILSNDLTNRFFYIGKGLPFYYGVRGFRTIFFGVMESKMYINWLVLTAYNVVFTPLGLWMVVRGVWTKAGSGAVAGRPGSATAAAQPALLGAGAAV